MNKELNYLINLIDKGNFGCWEELKTFITYLRPEDISNMNRNKTIIIDYLKKKSKLEREAQEIKPDYFEVMKKRNERTRKIYEISQLVKSKNGIRKQFPLTEKHEPKWTSMNEVAKRSFSIRIGKALKNYIYDTDKITGEQKLKAAYVVSELDRNMISKSIWEEIQEYSCYREDFKKLLFEIYSSEQELLYDMSIFIDNNITLHYKAACQRKIEELGTSIELPISIITEKRTT